MAHNLLVPDKEIRLSLGSPNTSAPKTALTKSKRVELLTILKKSVFSPVGFFWQNVKVSVFKEEGIN